MDRSQKTSLVKSIVTVFRSDENTGLGVYVEGDYIVTAAHCLPKVPNRDLPGDDIVEVVIEGMCEGSRAKVFVMYADVCGDIAVLATRTLKGTDLPHDYMVGFRAVTSKLESAHIAIGELQANESVPIHVYTHESQWHSGVAKLISPDFPFLALGMNGDAAIMPGTSGAPVFDEEGGVIGVISISPDDKSGEADAVSLATALPRWVLRQLCPLET